MRNSGKQSVPGPFSLVAASLITKNDHAAHCRHGDSCNCKDFMLPAHDFLKRFGSHFLKLDFRNHPEQSWVGGEKVSLLIEYQQSVCGVVIDDSNVVGFENIRGAQ